jgi:hypothetical protein
MADRIVEKLTTPSIEKPFFEIFHQKDSNVRQLKIYLPIRRITGLLLAISTIFHDYPKSISDLTYNVLTTFGLL